MKIFTTAGGPPFLHVERSPTILYLILEIATELQITGLLVHTRFLNEPILPSPKYFEGTDFLENKYNEDFIEIIVETEDDKFREFINRLRMSDL